MRDATQIAPRLVFLILAGERLNPVSRTYYHQTRAARLGKLWTTIAEDASAGLEARTERVRQGIESIKGTWRRLTALYDDDDRQGDAEREDVVQTGPFAFGENPCFLDFAVAGRIKFVMDGLTPTEVESLTISEGDRLLRLVESLEKYYKC